jgi:tRNA pseudouridine13 synthase
LPIESSSPLSSSLLSQTGVTDDLPYAYGEPLFKGVLRQTPESFYVEEILGFEPSGEGEHVFLFIEKIGINTQQVAERLAKLTKIPVKNISYAGMKDRHAVSRQWFSVHLPGKSEPDWQLLNNDELTVLSTSRHLKKLRRGVHQGNRFVIVITSLDAEDTDLASTELAERLSLIIKHGVPNYFGEQRFGHNGNNLVKVRQWFAGQFTPKRYQRGIYLSAARSYLFNQLLARRVELQSWNSLTQGELLLLAGSNSVFLQGNELDLVKRLEESDIHLTGPMYGRQGNVVTESAVASLEQEVLTAEPELLFGLEKQGLKAERRSLRLVPEQFSYHLENQRLELDFILPRGSFATALIRECIHFKVSDNR